MPRRTGRPFGMAAVRGSLWQRVGGQPWEEKTGTRVVVVVVVVGVVVVEWGGDGGVCG